MHNFIRKCRTDLTMCSMHGETFSRERVKRDGVYMRGEQRRECMNIRRSQGIAKENQVLRER